MFSLFFLFTSIDDLSEEIASAMKVLGGAIPSPVFELMFALGDGLFGAFCHGHDDAWVVANQATLFTSQSCVYVGIQVRIRDWILFDGIRHQIVGLAGSSDSPIKDKDENKRRLIWFFFFLIKRNNSFPLLLLFHSWKIQWFSNH